MSTSTMAAGGSRSWGEDGENGEGVNGSPGGEEDLPGFEHGPLVPLDVVGGHAEQGQHGQGLGGYEEGDEGDEQGEEESGEGEDGRW